MVKKYEGGSPFDALTALIMGRTNPTIPTPINVRMPSPKSKMAGMLRMIYSKRLNCRFIMDFPCSSIPSTLFFEVNQMIRGTKKPPNPVK